MASPVFPIKYHSAVLNIVDADEKDISVILDAIKYQSASLNKGTLKKEISSSIQEKTKKDFSDLVKFLASISTFIEYSGLSRESVIQQLISVVSVDEKLSSLDAMKLERLKERLESFLKADSVISLAAKASRLQADHEKVYTEATINTDIRPVFDPELTEDCPVSFVSFHDLKIRYREASQDKELHIFMDSRDLKSLEKALIEARRKQETLEDFLSKNSIGLWLD